MTKNIPQLIPCQYYHWANILPGQGGIVVGGSQIGLCSARKILTRYPLRRGGPFSWESDMAVAIDWAPLEMESSLINLAGQVVVRGGLLIDKDNRAKGFSPNALGVACLIISALDTERSLYCGSEQFYVPIEPAIMMQLAPTYAMNVIGYASNGYAAPPPFFGL